MKVKMLIALAVSALLATSFAVAAESMQAVDSGAALQAAPVTPENAGAPEQQMLSDNSNISAAQMPGDMASNGSAEDATADNATGDDY